MQRGRLVGRRSFENFLWRQFLVLRILKSDPPKDGGLSSINKSFSR